MTIEREVADAASPKEALLVIARALDTLMAPIPADPWQDWDQAVDDVVNAAVDRSVALTTTETTAEVEIPPPSIEKQQARGMFESLHLRLHEHLGHSENWNHAYAIGGPMWLYLGNRDLVMTLPDQIKQALIEDVLEDSPQDAHEMGRDILKQACETGPGGVGMRMAEGDVG